MAFEGLNNLGHSGSNAIIVLNDNGRSYAPTVSLLSDSLKKLRNNPKYLEQQEKLEKKVKSLLPFGESFERAIDAAKAAVREIWDPTSFFENLGIRYNGPFDGHNIEALEKAFRNASGFDGPTVIHVLTEKGRGYGPAENDPIKRLHDIGNPKPGSYTAAFTEILIKEAESREDLVAITAAMPDSTGLLPFSERFPERFFDVGIAEQHATTAAAGMAMGGLRPVIAVYATFLNRAFDQINFDVALHEQPVIFCIDRAGVTGPDGASHHGLLDMMLLSKVPGMTMFAPSSYQELQQMFSDALEITDGPIAIRYPRTPARLVSESEVGNGLKARRVAEGNDVCILSVGKMLSVAEEASDLLSEHGLSSSVWDVRCVTPLDQEMILNAHEHSVVVTIEDGISEGGIGSTISSQLRNLPGPSPKVHVLGVPISFVEQGNPEDLLSSLGLDAAGLVETVLASLLESP